MRYERWEREFRPITNPLNETAFDGCLFETYGADEAFVGTQPENTVWTWIEVDGRAWIAPGRHRVNRMGYFVTVKPWQPEQPSIRLNLR